MKKQLHLLGILTILLIFSFTLLVGFTPKTSNSALKTKTSPPKTVQKKIIPKPIIPVKTPLAKKPTPTPKPATSSKPPIKAKIQVPVKTPVTDAGKLKVNSTKTLFWKIKAGDATVYLLGSMHISKPDMFPLNKAAEDAFNSASNLVVEVNINDTAAMMRSQNKLLYEANDSIYNHLSTIGKEKVEALTKDYKLNPEGVKALKIWVLDSTILSLQYPSLGFGPGVDSYFLGKAKDKKILELEGVDFQFDLLNSFTDEEQEKGLLEDTKDSATTKSKLNQLYDAYKASDEKKLTDMLLGEMKLYSENYYNKMYVERNIVMANKIDEYLKTKETYFVVAGAAHFIGDASVVELLKQKGYEVSRIN